MPLIPLMASMLCEFAPFARYGLIVSGEDIIVGKTVGVSRLGGS